MIIILTIFQVLINIVAHVDDLNCMFCKLWHQELSCPKSLSPGIPQLRHAVYGLNIPTFFVTRSVTFSINENLGEARVFITPNIQIEYVLYLQKLPLYTQL